MVNGDSHAVLGPGVAMYKLNHLGTYVASHVGMTTYRQVYFHLRMALAIYVRT